MILDEHTDKVYISAETYAQHPTITKRLLKALDGENVRWELLNHTRYSWCRDYMPIQIAEDKFLQYRYFPDYMDDDQYRAYITDPSETLQSLGIETVKTDIILDGGNVIKCKDCVIMVDKVFKENAANYTQSALIDRLEGLFGCEVLFLPWDKYEIYGHADGIVRYVSEGKVLMTNYHDYDSKFADAFLNVLSKRFDVNVLEYTRKTHSMNWAYINFLQTKQAIFVPVFGKEEDEQSVSQITQLYPSYEGHVVPVKMNGIVKDGGAINCITWNIKE